MVCVRFRGGAGGREGWWKGPTPRPPFPPLPSRAVPPLQEAKAARLLDYLMKPKQVSSKNLVEEVRARGGGGGGGG